MTTLLDDTTMAIIMADLDRTCCLCEATYDARTMAEELRHNEYCPKCMEEEFGADWADLTATEEQKYGKEGKPADSTGKGSGTHQQADDDGSTCCSDEDEEEDSDEEEDEDTDGEKEEYDDMGVLCRYTEKDGWYAIEDHCVECGYRCEECDCETDEAWVGTDGVPGAGRRAAPTRAELLLRTGGAE